MKKKKESGSIVWSGSYPRGNSSERQCSYFPTRFIFPSVLSSSGSRSNVCIMLSCSLVHFPSPQSRLPLCRGVKTRRPSSYTRPPLLIPQPPPFPARLCCYFSCSCQRQVYTGPGTDWRTFAPHRYRGRPLSARPPVYRVPTWDVATSPLDKACLEATWMGPAVVLECTWKCASTVQPSSTVERNFLRQTSGGVIFLLWRQYMTSRY